MFVGFGDNYHSLAAYKRSEFNEKQRQPNTGKAPEHKVELQAAQELRLAHPEDHVSFKQFLEKWWL